jgi:hypothetical protein
MNRGWLRAIIMCGVAVSVSMAGTYGAVASSKTSPATGPHTVQPASAEPQRPSLQALSQYRSGNKTAVWLASIVPVPGAVNYRLERYDSVKRVWVFDGLCERTCIRFLDNARTSSQVNYRMRAVSASGALSLPSVTMAVSPILWNSKKHPGSRLDIRLGVGSAGIVGKAYLDAMIDLAGVCALDLALRQALSKAVDLHYANAARWPKAATFASALAATFTEELYKAVYDGQCALINGLASNMIVALDQVSRSGTALLSIETYWAGQHSYDLPDLWICHVSLLPKGKNVEPFYRIDTFEKPCLSFAADVWTVV